MTRPDLCLEFANTRYWRGQKTPTETLNTPADLAAWTKVPRPPSQKEFERALELRETLHRLFDAVAQGKPPPGPDFDGLNAALAEAPARRTLKRGKETFDWELDPRSSTALALLAPVLWSAGDLLASTSLGKVRRCANPECLYLFLDESRAGKRRWCTMSSCGNRAKARRHYHKSRQG
ncbi:MAG: ABATE domain-containing protein [Reyranella sp.]|nr:ABATE domain-containing protein [Reyranella sp.]